MILYGYALSSASFRVRVALALKNLPYDSVIKNLKSGEHRLGDHLTINSQGFVPSLALANGAVLSRHLEEKLGLDKATRDGWYRHWIEVGFAALERSLVKDDAGRFCHGDTPSLADICLVPQVFNARRFSVDVNPYPRILAIDAECRALSAFQIAAPENQ